MLFIYYQKFVFFYYITEIYQTSITLLRNVLVHNLTMVLISSFQYFFLLRYNYSQSNLIRNLGLFLVSYNYKLII